MTSIIVLLLITVYLTITLVLGVYGYKVSKKTVQDYFLADRKLGTIVVFFTLAATNFSAFTFLGFAGSAYRMGYSFYGLMAFGTSFMAISFYVIGRKVWRLGKKKGYVTPPELIGKETGSYTLRLLFMAVMVVFTLPYLAIQPMSAGYVISSLTGGDVPYFYGAVFLTAFIILYVFLGGMRTIAWTDVLQGLMIMALLSIGLVVIVSNLGGISSAHTQSYAVEPGLFQRQGTVTIQIWFSYAVLWSLCDPMFPQLFQRFFVPKSEKSLKRASVVYPLMVSLLFLLPVIIGVVGRGAIPGLGVQEADSILPMMLDRYAPVWLAALIMSGGFAAFMSTADSQLLSMSSMFTRDLIHPILPEKKADDYKLGHLMVVILALIGLAFAYDPPASIFTIVTWAFTGLAILYPVTFSVLYFDVEPLACISSISTGLLLLALYHLQIPPTFGFLPAMPIVAASSLVLFITDRTMIFLKSRDLLKGCST